MHICVLSYFLKGNINECDVKRLFCSLDFKKAYDNNSWKDILNLKNFCLKKIHTNFHILKFLYKHWTVNLMVFITSSLIVGYKLLLNLDWLAQTIILIKLFDQ